MDQSPQAIAADLPRHSPILFSAPIRISAGMTGDVERICIAVCHDLSCSGVRILSSLPIFAREVNVQFQAPNGQDVTRQTKMIRGGRRNEWMWEYELEFIEELSPELLENSSFWE